MAMGPDERSRQLDKLFKDIGDKVEQQMKEANSRLKDYYKSEYDAAIRDGEAALSRGDSLSALFYQMKAKNLSNALRVFE